ncbi:MAG: fused MFS/spermidine synthase, partial [Myxococcota bacterium]
GLWLYPSHGLVAAAIGTGVVNALAAVSFLTLFGNRRTGAILANLAVTAACALLLFNLSAIQDQVSRWYAARQVAARFESMSQHLKRLDMKHVEQTRYQEIWRYDLHWDWGTERCLELDGQLQTCESWAADYHHGLVDVPVTLFEAERPLEVLVVGGGDFIPMAFLAEHKNVARVDQVDIDPQFMEFAKRSELLAKFHKHSYRDPRLNLVVADAMSFVRHSKSSYDLVLLDLPGLMHDKLLPLYSQEFFGAVRQRLKPDGVVVTWVYPESSRPKHAQILRQTFLAAGFGRLARYRAYGEPDGH